MMCGGMQIRAACRGGVAICILFVGLICRAADPVVSNVTVVQRPGTKLVDIGYDLAGDGPVGVAIRISPDDGETWDVPATSLSGDVGPSVAVGVGKTVVWDMAADWPGHRTTQLRVEIAAGAMHTVVFDLGACGSRTGGGDLAQQVMQGDAAEVPTLAVMFGWTFAGWDAGFAAVTGDLTVTAQYARVAKEDSLYVVVDLSAGAQATEYPVSYHAAVRDGGATMDYKTTKLILRRIPAGTFTMGAPTDELGRAGLEDAHQVILTQDFHAGVFEVTQKQWYLVMGTWPSYYSEARDARPVEGVSWNDVRGGVWPGAPSGSGQPGLGTFVQRLRARTGINFDLPTEAQWEYACRAGTTTALNSGRDLTATEDCPHMAEVGRYGYNGGRDPLPTVLLVGTATVGSYLPNAWGLYDMHGNCFELCLDAGGYYLETETDPVGLGDPAYRMARGGGWWAGASWCRSAFRVWRDPDSRNTNYGFRLLLPGRHTVLFDLGEHGVRTGGGALVQRVWPGEAATAPEFEVAAGWLFVRWDREFSSVTGDLTVTAQFAEDKGYTVVDLSNGPEAESYPVTHLDAVPAGGWTAAHKTTLLVLRCIPAGTFTMGSPTSELGRFSTDETQHDVTLTKDFHIGVFEVTQKQWERVMGTWPSHFSNAECRDARPVENVSWDAVRGGSWPGEPSGNGQPAAETFIQLLRERTGIDLDLPTEAQWEYACRAGTTTALNSGKNLTDLEECPNMSEVGRYHSNHPVYSSQSGTDLKGGTAAAGSHLPNGWGVYDMHGNVFEWCLDYYGTYPGAESDPVGPETGDTRVFRGGSWDHAPWFGRAARRSGWDQSTQGSVFGFRVWASATSE